MSEKYLKV